MKPQKGQLNDLAKNGIAIDKVTIICEAGNDNGQTFRGEFLAKCGSKKVRIQNGVLLKIIN